VFFFFLFYFDFYLFKNQIFMYYIFSITIAQRQDQSELYSCLALLELSPLLEQNTL